MIRSLALALALLAVFAGPVFARDHGTDPRFKRPCARPIVCIAPPAAPSPR